MLPQNSFSGVTGIMTPGSNDGMAEGKMEETVILDLQQMMLFLLLRVRDITETTMQEAGLDEVQS